MTDISKLQVQLWREEQQPLASYSAIVSHWHLESPVHDSPVSDAASVTVRCWALAADPQLQSHLHMVISLTGRTVSIPALENRADVVLAICKAEPGGHPQLRCGFMYSLPAAEAMAGFQIGFETDCLIHPAARISVR
jgi:hypothetical protein